MKQQETSKVVTKNDLASIMHEEFYAYLTKTLCTQFIESLCRHIKESVDNGDTVHIKGFAKAMLVESKRTQARDIGRNKLITLTPHKVVKIRASKVWSK